jgi:hypothetical protein
MNEKQRRSLGERIAGWRERSSILVLLFLLSSLITSISVLTVAALDVHDRYRKRFEWREAEYAKITSLRAGFEIGKFTEVLGPPTIVLRQGKFVENVFDGRDYWIQAVSNRAGTVQQYAVTSCDRDFRPTFGMHPLVGFDVTLQESTLRSVGPKEAASSIVLERELGAHASTFYDKLDLGAQGVYKQFAWGLNDTCPPPANLGDNLPEWNDQLERAPASLKAAEERAVANTYAETAPGVTFPKDSLSQATPYQIGVHPQIAALLPQ